MASARDQRSVLEKQLGLEAQQCPDDRGTTFATERTGKTDDAEAVRLGHVECGKGLQDPTRDPRRRRCYEVKGMSWPER